MDEKRLSKEEQCNIIIENRKKISVSGVIDVDNFDDESVVLITQMGALIVKGTDFHINKLNVDTGELVVEGDIDSCTFNNSYSAKNKGSLLARMFK